MHDTNIKILRYAEVQYVIQYLCYGYLYVQNIVDVSKILMKRMFSWIRTMPIPTADTLLKPQ